MLARQLLRDDYQIDSEEKMVVAGREGYISNRMFYFTMNALNSETIHLEQAVLAYYLVQNGLSHTAIPIKNKQEEWFTEKDGGRYILYQVGERQIEKESIGTALAKLHQVGAAYQFEPGSISSYGQWKKLWIEKITVYEENITKFVNENVTTGKGFYMDALPYMIGMSENAIQYLRETEEMEMRYAEGDSGTFCLRRFIGQTNQEVLWPDELVYDHPARDIAEYIRNIFLTGGTDMGMLSFLEDYQQVRALSFFSWRLIYARLIFPIHLFDALEESMRTGDINFFKNMFERQEQYEKRLTNFFQKVGIDIRTTNITELNWLTTF